ncbi:hypothetical protein OAR07_00240 [Flavobacteriaceae bacterium]|nr:hypothetical protein [Flavobacteriaceae bacterium]
MKKLITLSAIFFTSVSVFAQNYIYDLNQTGFSLEALAGFPEGSNLYGINPSYTWNGRLTAGIGIFYEFIDDYYLNAEIYAPNISYLLFKKELDQNILNFGINSSYQITKSSSPNNLSSSNFNIGIGASMQFNLDDNFKFTLGTGFSWGSIKVKNGSFEDTQGVTLHGFYGNLLFNKFFVQPQISFIDIFYESLSSFGISLGYLFNK